MGYSTTFQGQINISPALSVDEIDYLVKFADTRRMNRANGPYFVDGTGYKGQDNNSDIIDFNQPPAGQPGLWCQWVPNKNGDALEWDGGEKFYDSVEWMQYLIDHFLKPGAIAPLDFLLKNHVLNGEILAQGEDIDDRWKLIVQDNVVTTKQLE